jgi:tripartite-type tricarboxylate transporter receptor subunit TctC
MTRCISVFGIVALAVSLSVAAFPGHVSAAGFPEKPLSMIVAFAPGGGTDVAARVIAEYVKPHLGQSIAVENKPGAGGQIGFTALAKARPDGYTIGFLNVPSIFLIKMLRPDATYKMSDFAPIANIQLDPVLLAVKPDSPFKTMKDFVDAAKQSPGKLNVAGDGPQTNNHLQAVIMEKQLGIKVNFVSYNGSGPAITALLGGQVDAAVPSLSPAVPHVETGRMRALALFDDERFPGLSSVPTAQEATGVAIPPIGASMRGIAAPAGVPAERIKVLEDAFAKLVKDPKFVAKAKEMGVPIKYLDSQKFQEFLASAEKELAGYADLLKK